MVEERKLGKGFCVPRSSLKTWTKQMVSNLPLSTHWDRQASLLGQRKQKKQLCYVKETVREVPQDNLQQNMANCLKNDVDAHRGGVGINPCTNFLLLNGLFFCIQPWMKGIFCY